MCKVTDTPKVFVDEIQKYYQQQEFTTFLQELKVQGYQTDEHDRFNHEYGIGGKWIKSTLLTKDDKPVIISIHHVQWDTSSDDSQDTTILNVRITYLVEDDPIGQQIFEKMKK